MSVVCCGGIILGFWFGCKALDRRVINGITGVIALFVILCFVFTTMVGWCQFLRYSADGSLFFSLWSLLLFSAWGGLFAASVLRAWKELCKPISEMQFSGLRDKYIIVYDEPKAAEDSVALPPVDPAAPEERVKIAIPFVN